MPKSTTKNVAMRKNISLIGEDADLIDKLKATIEQQLNIKLKDTAVVRMALRKLETSFAPNNK